MNRHHKFLRTILTKTKNGYYKGSLSHQKQIIDLLLGYDKEQLQQHLNKFSYDKNDYHIDHIVPLNLFIFNNKTDIKNILLADSLVNLMPLSSKDNLAKSDKITLQYVPKWHINSIIDYIENIYDLKLISKNTYKQYYDIYSVWT